MTWAIILHSLQYLLYNPKTTAKCGSAFAFELKAEQKEVKELTWCQAGDHWR